MVKPRRMNPIGLRIHPASHRRGILTDLKTSMIAAAWAILRIKPEFQANF
jgi:hypothetical protein